MLVNLLLLCVSAAMWYGHPWLIIDDQGEIQYPQRGWRW